MAKRHPLAREEIGLLMSFAKTPEAFTTDAIERLVAGMTTHEFLDFFSRAGLPPRTAASMIAPEDGEQADLPWAQRSLSYRRAIVGTISVYVVGVIVLSILGGQPLGRVVGTVLTVGGLGWLVHKVIVVLSPRVSDDVA